MGIIQEGIDAEQWFLKELNLKSMPCFQADAVSFEKGRWILSEIKHQERFSPPPFEGHGLPLRQVKTRLLFQENTKLRIRLVIKEKNSENIFWQWLDVLESGEYFDTKGDRSRRVYPIKNFENGLIGA